MLGSKVISNTIWVIHVYMFSWRVWVDTIVIFRICKLILLSIQMTLLSYVLFTSLYHLEDHKEHIGHTLGTIQDEWWVYSLFELCSCSIHCDLSWGCCVMEMFIQCAMDYLEDIEMMWNVKRERGTHTLLLCDLIVFILSFMRFNYTCVI